MTSNHYNISFRTKIFGVAASLLILLIIIAAFSYNRLSLVNDEVYDLSEHLIPISGLVNEINALALEQEVHFERVLKLYEIHPLNIEHIIAEQNQFETRSKKVDAMLKEAIHLAQTQGKRPLEHTSQNTTLISALTKIEKEHRDLHDHALQIITLLKNSTQKETAHLLEDEREKEKEDFDREVEAIRLQLQDTNAKAAHETRTHQRHVLQLSVIITGIAIVFGILYSSRRQRNTPTRV